MQDLDPVLGEDVLDPQTELAAVALQELRAAIFQEEIGALEESSCARGGPELGVGVREFGDEFERESPEAA